MKSNIKWAIKILILSFFLSFFFSFVSQSLFPTLSIFLSIFIIIFFIIISVIFDMIAVGVTSISLEKLEKHKKEKAYFMALKLYKHTDKVASFCGDVVGDICSILSGAGGVSLILNINLQDKNIYFLVTCLVSSLIAGLTIFGKAIMKRYSVDNCEKVVLLTAKVLDFSFANCLKKVFQKKDKGKVNFHDKNSKKTKF